MRTCRQSSCEVTAGWHGMDIERNRPYSVSFCIEHSHCEICCEFYGDGCLLMSLDCLQPSSKMTAQLNRSEGLFASRSRLGIQGDEGRPEKRLESELHVSV